MGAGLQAAKWRGPESNRRHHGFQPCALPTELPRRAVGKSSDALGEERVLVAVGRRAAAQEADTVVAGADLVPRAWRDQDRVAGRDPTARAVELHLAAAIEPEVDLRALA